MRDTPQEAQQRKTENGDADGLVRVGVRLRDLGGHGMENPGQDDVADHHGGNEPMQDDRSTRVAIAGLWLHVTCHQRRRFRAVVSRSSASQTSLFSSPLNRRSPYSRIRLSGTLTSGV